MENLTPICQYCNEFSELATGREIYPHRKDLYSLVFYQCKPCKAYVGTHQATCKPLGRLANKALRKAKSNTHAVFDLLWKEKHMSRTDAYDWLSKKLGLKLWDCHIGMFDMEQCKKAVEVSAMKFRDLSG